MPTSREIFSVGVAIIAVGCITPISTRSPFASAALLEGKDRSAEAVGLQGYSQGEYLGISQANSRARAGVRERAEA